MFRTSLVSVEKLKNLLFLTSIAAGVIALAGCESSSGAGADGAEAATLLVDVAAVESSQGYELTRQFAGRVEARRASDVGFDLAGELVEVAVDEGAAVDEGDVLAVLDKARLRAQRAEADAALEQARSAALLAEKTLERSREAASYEGISEQELDLAEDAATAAAAAVKAAEARLRSVDVELGKATLRAPFDAIVVARFADEGRIVAPGQAILGLQERAASEVRIGVAGNLASELASGDAQQLIVEGRQVAATVKAVLPLRDPTTRTVDVLLTVEDEHVLPGDIARLDVMSQIDEPGFWLPVDALAEGSRGLWTAYVAVPADDPASSATHLLEARPVELLYEATDRVYVRGVLEEGELYVADGLTRVVPNQLVRLRATDMSGSGS